MLIAKKTLYRDPEGNYRIRQGREGLRWFLCGSHLWEFFPLSGPGPKVIWIELHDTPAKDRVAIRDVFTQDYARFDGTIYTLSPVGYDWLQPYFEKHGTVYAELWY